jgi:hypothetical protein
VFVAWNEGIVDVFVGVAMTIVASVIRAMMVAPKSCSVLDESLMVGSFVNQCGIGRYVFVLVSGSAIR